MTFSNLKMILVCRQDVDLAMEVVRGARVNALAHDRPVQPVLRQRDMGLF